MRKYQILLFALITGILISWIKPLRRGENRIHPNYSDTSVCDKVFDGKYSETDQLTMISLGGVSPGQKMTILIKGTDRKNFPSPPEKLYTGKTVCVKGPVEMQNGLPSVLVKDPGQIVVQQ
jgi:hypothetical protein